MPTRKSKYGVMLPEVLKRAILEVWSSSERERRDTMSIETRQFILSRRQSSRLRMEAGLVWVLYPTSC
jgi:hypothetical protein